MERRFSRCSGGRTNLQRDQLTTHPHQSLHTPPGLSNLAFVTSSYLSECLKPARSSSSASSARGRWLFSRSSRTISMSSDRLESAKAGVISALAGSFAVAPVSVGFTLFTDNGLNAQWELSIDMLAISLFLFGIVYRYVVRGDTNPMLKQGAIGAFAVIRAASALRAPDICVPFPLQCGPPLSYFSWPMLTQGAITVAESLVAFGFAAVAIDLAFRNTWLQQAPSQLSDGDGDSS